MRSKETQRALLTSGGITTVTKEHRGDPRLYSGLKRASTPSPPCLSNEGVLDVALSAASPHYRLS